MSSTTEPPFLVKRRGDVVWLTLNRPAQRNALNAAIFAELDGAIDQLRSDESCSIVVLRGAGTCFSGGHDLAEIADAGDLSLAHAQADSIAKLSDLPQLVIGAVHGYCFTGALELAVACDIVISSSDAHFADTHARFGMTPVWGLSQRLPRRVGISRAIELMASGRTVGAEEALQIGLCDRVFAASEYERELECYAAHLASQSAGALRTAKQLVRGGAAMPLTDALAFERYHSPGALPDMVRRIDAFQSSKGAKGA